MHLHCHLAECIKDFGPVYAFWCFSFERYNGILGSYRHNNSALPIQMMRKFLEEDALSAAIDASESPLFKEHFANLIIRETDGLSGTLQQIYNGSALLRNNLCNINPELVSWREDVATQHPFPPFKTRMLEELDHEDLKLMYSSLLWGSEEVKDIFVPQAYLQFERIEIYGGIYDSRRCPSPRANHVLAHWFVENNISLNDDADLRPGIVEYFMKQTVEVHRVSGDTILETYILACVSWFKSYEKRNYFTSPLEAWYQSGFEVQLHFYLSVGYGVGFVQ